MPTDWEQRYQSGETSWEKGSPSPGLVDFLSTHPNLARGSVLVPGCGTGHDAREFAKVGFDVTGLDLAPSAIRLSVERTKAAGLKAMFLQQDFLRDEPTSRFDWIFEHTLFCAIDPSERDFYVAAVLRWLKPNGYYLAVNYFITDGEGPPFCTDREEQWRRFSPHFELLEEWEPRSYPNRVGKERMFWWRRKQSFVSR
jgi:SAM-dependent methyltransferase